MHFLLCKANDVAILNSLVIFVECGVIFFFFIQALYRYIYWSAKKGGKEEKKEMGFSWVECEHGGKKTHPFFDYANTPCMNLKLIN